MALKSIPAWMTVTPSSGEGTKSVEVKVTENTGAARNAQVDVVGGGYNK